MDAEVQCWPAWRAASNGHTRQVTRRYLTWTTYLPYVSVTLLGGLMLWDQPDKSAVDHPILEWGFVVVVALVLMRQFLILRENRRVCGRPA